MSLKAVSDALAGLPGGALPLVATRRPTTIVLEGHSIVANNSTPQASWGSPGFAPAGTGNTYSQGVFERAMIAANYPFRVLANNAVGGDTSAQILARIPGDLALGPDWLYLDPFTNDALDNVPLATTIANVNQMLALANAQNVQVILALDGPRSGLAQSQVQLATNVANYYKDYAFDHPNVLVFDQAPFRWDTTSLASSLAYTPLAGVTLDGVHPNAWGAGLAGTNGTLSLAGLLKGIFGSGQFYPGPSGGSDGSANGDTANIVQNPLMCGTGGTLGAGAGGTAASSYTLNRTGAGTLTVTGSIATRASLAGGFPGLYDDGTFGNVTVMAMGGSSALSFSDSCQLQMSPVGSGHITGLSGPWEIEVEVAAVANTGSTVAEVSALAFINSGGGGYSINLNSDVNGWGADPMGVTKFQGKLRSRPFYAPANASVAGGNTQLSVIMSPNAGGAMTGYVSNPKWRLLGA